MGLNEHSLITIVVIARIPTKTCVTGLLVINYLKKKRAPEIAAKVKYVHRPSDNYIEADIIK